MKTATILYSALAFPLLATAAIIDKSAIATVNERAPVEAAPAYVWASCSKRDSACSKAKRAAEEAQVKREPVQEAPAYVWASCSKRDSACSKVKRAAEEAQVHAEEKN